MCAALAGVDVLGNDGEGVAHLATALARMTSGEVSTLHAALFFATVWIASSLRIHRLRALWRAGLGLTAVRGISGRLPSGEPKARAATGGSVGGAGTSGPRDPIGGRPLLEHFAAGRNRLASHKCD